MWSSLVETPAVEKPDLITGSSLRLKKMSMDRVFKSDEKQYISPPISLASFLETAASAEDKLRDLFSPQGADTRQNFAEFMEACGYDDQTSSRVVQNVDDSFKVLFDANPMQNFEITFPPKNSRLKTHKILHQIREDFPTTTNKNQLVLRGKYFKYREQELRRRFTGSNEIAARDIVITVHLLAPMNRPPESFENTSIRNRCEVKLVVRGDTPLSKLKNKIFCASDLWCNRKDDETMHDRETYFSSLYPSNFIFVHDTFYVDKGPNTVDITEPIRQFMDRKPGEFGSYKVEDIASARVIDLSLRLGQPYVYQHQGKCEHLLIFSDLRLLNAGDEQRDSEYPIRVYDNVHQVLCCTCNNTVAVFVVTESDRMPMCPAYMCYSCFRSFHYDGDTRIGNFTAYHYIDRAGME
uniref:snRNA-activating protein complex subunit 3 n=1 Tax=Ditylenchus dipsaci TaxID=166011 RepID=A0A915DQJ2_9BILA